MGQPSMGELRGPSHKRVTTGAWHSGRRRRSLPFLFEIDRSCQRAVTHMRTDSSWGNEQRRPSDSVTTPMDGWFSDINHFERVVMAKARTCRSLSEDEINRMVGWSVFADKSWSHNSGSSSKGSLGKHYLRIIGEGGEPSLPSFRLLSAIVNNAFLSGEAVKRGLSNKWFFATHSSWAKYYCFFFSF